VVGSIKNSDSQPPSILWRNDLFNTLAEQAKMKSELEYLLRIVAQ
jgi:hypothetical protein